MKASGTILMPIYFGGDVRPENIQHYMSEIDVEFNGKVWHCDYSTPVGVFKDVKKTEEGYKAYTKWLESYLKRSVANVMINDGVQFRYA